MMPSAPTSIPNPVLRARPKAPTQTLLPVESEPDVLRRSRTDLFHSDLEEKETSGGASSVHKGNVTLQPQSEEGVFERFLGPIAQTTVELFRPGPHPFPVTPDAELPDIPRVFAWSQTWVEWFRANPVSVVESEGPCLRVTWQVGPLWWMAAQKRSEKRRLAELAIANGAHRAEDLPWLVTEPTVVEIWDPAQLIRDGCLTRRHPGYMEQVYLVLQGGVATARCGAPCPDKIRLKVPNLEALFGVCDPVYIELTRTEAPSGFWAFRA